MQPQLIRTQIYLSAAQQQALGALAAQRQVPKSELIREALDEWMARQQQSHDEKLALLRKAFGTWKDREDITDSAEWVAQLRRKNDQSRAEALKPHWEGRDVAA